MMSLQKLNYSLLTTTINQQQNRKNKTLITPTREVSPSPPSLPPAITNAVTSDLINISRCSDSGKSSSCSPTTIPDCSFDSGIEAVIPNTITTGTNTTNTNTCTLNLLPTSRAPHNTNMQLHKNLQQFERILQALERDREHYYKLRERLSKITERNKKKPLSEQIFCNVCCTEIQTNQLKTFVKCDSCQKLICRNIKCGDWLPKLAQWECELCQTSKDSLDHTSSWVANQLSFNEHKLAYPLRARSEIFIPITDCNDDNANFESISQTGANSAVITVEQKLKIRKYVEEIVAQLLGGNLDAISVQQLSKSDNYLKLFTKYHSILSEIFSNMEEVLIKQQQQKQRYQKNSSDGDGNGNGFDLSSPKTNNKQNGGVPYNGEEDDVDNTTHQQQPQQSRKNSTDFTDISETRLRQMIQKIIAETVKMPPLMNNQAVSEIALDHRSSQTTLDQPSAKTNGQRHRSEYYFEPKVYQDLLATAVLNKIVDKQSQNKVMSESTPDLRKTHHDVLDTNYNLECQSTTSGSSVEPNSDCSYSEIDRLLNNDVDKMTRSAGRESEMSDYVAAHMVPLPDLSNMPTESEEDDFVSVTSSAKGEGNWENNWLFKKKPGPISGNVSGILIPNPKEDVRAQIGDKAADEFSDLSELGSETDDSSSSLHTKIDPLNHRLLNKELIGGQNGKMILDELIEQSTVITSSGEYEGRDHQYTDTLNEHVIDAPAKNEAINANISKQSEVKGEAAEENKTEDVDFTAEIIEQPSSVIEILAAMALRPMIAVPTGDQSLLLTSDELTKLEEMKDLALVEIKSKGGAVEAHNLEMIPEEINEIKPFEDFIFDLKNLPPPKEMSLQFIEENLILKPPTEMEEALMDIFIVPPPEFEVDVTESGVIEKNIVEINENILKEDVTSKVQKIEETHESENDVSMEKPAINNEESEETMTVVESNAVQETINIQNTEKNYSILQELTNLQEPSTSKLMQMDTNDALADVGAADVLVQTISEENALREKYERNETIDIDSIEPLKKEATDKTVAPETNTSEENIVIKQHNMHRTTQAEAFNEDQAFLEQNNLELETIQDNFETNNTSLSIALKNADNILEDTILETKNENISETIEDKTESLTCNESKDTETNSILQFEEAQDEPSVVLANNENTKLEEESKTLLKQNYEPTNQPTMAEALTNVILDKENQPDDQENAKPIPKLKSDNVADLSEIEMAPISESVITAETLISNEIIKENQEVIDSFLHNLPTVIEVLTPSINKEDPSNIEESAEVTLHLNLDYVAEPSVISIVKKCEIEMATIPTNVLTNENLTIAPEEDTNIDNGNKSNNPPILNSKPSLRKQPTIVEILTDSIDIEDPSNIEENAEVTPHLDLDNVAEPSVVSIIKKCEIEMATISTNVVKDESLTIAHEEDTYDYDGIDSQPSLLKQPTIVEVLTDSIDIEDPSNIEENAEVTPHLDLDNIAEPSVISIVKKYEIEIATTSKKFATEESLSIAHEKSKNRPSLNRQPTLTEIFEELMDKDSNILNISVKIESSEAQNLLKDKEVNDTVCSEVAEPSLVSIIKSSEIDTASMLEETISEEINKNQGSFLSNQHTVTDILTSFDKEDPSHTALDIEEAKSLTPLDNVVEPSLVSILKKSEIEVAYISENIMADEVSALPHEEIKNEEIETYINTISRQQTVAELLNNSEDEAEKNISVTVESSNKPDSSETNKIEEVVEATPIDDSSNKPEMQKTSTCNSKNEQVIGNVEETSGSINPSNINEPTLTPRIDLSNIAKPSLKIIENESEIEKLEKDLNETVENNDRLEIWSTDITNDIAKESTGEVIQSITCENVVNLIECKESTKEDIVISVQIEKTVDSEEFSKTSTNLIEEEELKITKEISESIISEPSVELQDNVILQSPLTEQSNTTENLVDFDVSIEKLNADQGNVMNYLLSNQLIADLLAQPLLDLNLQEETADHIIEPPSTFASMEFIEQTKIIDKGDDEIQGMEESLRDSTDNNAALVKITPEDEIENTSQVLIKKEAVCESRNGCSEEKNTEANLCVDSNLSTIPDTLESEGVIVTKVENMTDPEQIGSVSELCEAALIVNESEEESPPDVQESVTNSTQTIVAKVDIPFLKPQANLSENVISESSEVGPEKASNVSSEFNAEAPRSSIKEDVTTEPNNEATATVDITERSPQVNTTEPLNEAAVEIIEQSQQSNALDALDTDRTNVEEVLSKSESSAQVVEEKQTLDVSDTDKSNVDEAASKNEPSSQVVEEKHTSDVSDTDRTNVIEAASKNEPSVQVVEEKQNSDVSDTDRTNVGEAASKNVVEEKQTSDVSDTDRNNVAEAASKSESSVQVVEEKQTSDVSDTDKSKKEPSIQVVKENEVSEEVSKNINEAVNATITTEATVDKESTEIESKELPLTDIKADTQQENHDIINTESSTLIVTESAIPTDPTQQAETLQLIVKESASVEVSSTPPLQSSTESCEDCKTVKSFSLNEEEDTQVNLGNHMLLRRLHRQDCIANSNAPSLEDDSQYLNKKTIGLGDMCQQYIQDKRLLAALEKRRRQILVMHRYLSSFDETTDSSAEDELISAFQGNSENTTYSLGSTSPTNDSDPSSSSDCRNYSHPVGELYENSFHIFNNVLFSDQLTNDSSNTPPTDEEYIENDTNFEEVEITTNTINHHTIDHECFTTTNNNYNNNIITNTHQQQKTQQQQQQNHHQLLLSNNNNSCNERTSAVESSTTSSNQTIHNQLITKRCITSISHHDNNNKKRNDNNDDDDDGPSDDSDNVIEMKESDDIVAVLPKFVPGSIAEREHKKWFNAVEMPNNPYAPEALKRRISGSQESYIDLPNISPSKDSNPLEHLTQGKLNDEEQNQRENEYRRYSRDYYINNGRKSSSSNNSIHEANNQQPTKAESGEEKYSEENTLLPKTSASSSTNHTVGSITPDGLTDGDDVVYKAIPVQVVVVVEESVSSLDTVSSQKSIKSETYSTSGDDTETVRIYDFKKQETTVIRQNGDNHQVLEKEPESKENHEMKQKEETEKKGEAEVTMRERPKRLSLNRSESIGRGSTPTAFKFLQPKRKLINPSQVLSFEEDVAVLTTCFAERPVIEKEIVQALPSVKALAKAFLLSSSTSQPSQTEHTEPKKLKILTPTQKKSIDGTNKMVMVSSPYENEAIEDTTITSDLSSLETDPSSVIENTKDKPTLHSNPGTPTDTTNCKTIREGGANGGGGLRNNIAFFENLKFK